ncbi:MAG: transcriptional repressor LexA [Candidatus Eisenbacteria bacterium]|nr:transcriptional repressor LexA [Candidatus Eisenbacteria bacterium]
MGAAGVGGATASRYAAGDIGGVAPLRAGKPVRPLMRGPLAAPVLFPLTGAHVCSSMVHRWAVSGGRPVERLHAAADRTAGIPGERTVMTIRDDLSPTQERILKYITETIRDHDRSPTIREIGEEFGIASTNGVRYHLKVLEERGYIKREKGISRGIEWREHHVPSPARAGASEVPIVGRVAAGAPILAVENIEGELAVDEMFTRSKECFALRVNGDSMRGAGILDGDIVVVQPQSTARNGEVVVALIDDDATVKTYIKKKGRVVLRPENEEFDDIILDEKSGEARLLGKVVGLMRKI